MTYLIFDQDNELLDVLNFNSKEDLALYKANNPTHTLQEEDDFIFIEEDDVFVDDENFEW